jgi:signal transduction histidine kinase
VAALLDYLDGERLQARHVHLAEDLPAFAEPARTELLQIIHEAVSNALRHGAPTRLTIDFSLLAGRQPCLTIQDNGVGFDPATITRGHGLNNLAARALTLAATLDLDTAPGRGTTLRLTLPKPAEAA